MESLWQSPMSRFGGRAGAGRLKRSVDREPSRSFRSCAAEWAEDDASVYPEEAELQDCRGKRARDGASFDETADLTVQGVPLGSLPGIGNGFGPLVDHGDVWRALGLSVGASSPSLSSTEPAPPFACEASPSFVQDDLDNSTRPPSEFPEAVPAPQPCSNVCDADVERVVASATAAPASQPPSPNPQSLMLLTQRLLRENIALRRSLHESARRLTFLEHDLEVCCCFEPCFRGFPRVLWCNCDFTCESGEQRGSGKSGGEQTRPGADELPAPVSLGTACVQRRQFIVYLS
jgi:hypothetical protein